MSIAAYGAALLADIVENPADDTPRLVYADWLDENGDGDRADFIRVQVALERPVAVGHDSGRIVRRRDMAISDALRRRERELLLHNWTAWTPRLSETHSFEVILSEEWTYSGTPAVLFRRGFIAEVRCTLEQWLAHGPAATAGHPIEVVTLTDREPHTEPLGYGSAAPWAWRIMNKADAAHVIPGTIFRHLPMKPEDTIAWRDFDSRDAAITALSRACILHARSRPSSSAP
jgi:uncharacterized protein (TIGR02996 family)